MSPARAPAQWPRAVRGAYSWQARLARTRGECVAAGNAGARRPAGAAPRPCRGRAGVVDKAPCRARAGSPPPSARASVECARAAPREGRERASTRRAAALPRASPAPSPAAPARGWYARLVGLLRSVREQDMHMGCEWVARLANQLARGRVEAQVHDVGPRWESRLVLHDARARDRPHLCTCTQVQLRCGAHAVHTVHMRWCTPRPRSRWWPPSALPRAAGLA